MSDLFEKLLASSVQAHGHLCPGQVVGVRMALLGLRLVGFTPPLDVDEVKKLIVFVEMDRCAADAVAHTAGVTLGHRSLKFKDFGIMAATFLNLETGKAYRLVSTEESRDLADQYAPGIEDEAECQVRAYRIMPDEVLFTAQEVEVHLSELDLPGPPRRKVVCDACGQAVRDGKEKVVRGRVLCPPCAGEAYFRPLRPLDLSTRSRRS
ncbi:MAG: FmdE family protein [Thermodesulfobacteriota bacterium]